ncbi:hypothetical protein G5714_015903 [Onychostoma macrolepis]|uniref:Uncharacterized protein n=2 Tax=Onychostoma macrolepis TaxID=369639 RepID=A0A7J6C702_9TELE|nr:hypothetical protein G5714_015903 [Onychostoma macrolepis]
MSVHSAGAAGVAGVADRVAGGPGVGPATGLGGGLDSGLARSLGGGIGSGSSRGLGGGNGGGIGGGLVNGITGGVGAPGATVDYTQEQAVEMTERKTVLIRTVKTEDDTLESNTQEKSYSISGAADEGE